MEKGGERADRRVEFGRGWADENLKENTVQMHYSLQCGQGFRDDVSALKKGKSRYSSSWGNPTSELRDVTCHMGSHSVTCHTTQVNTSRLNPTHALNCYLSVR